MENKKNMCQAYPSHASDEERKAYFSCGAGGRYGDCDFADGYKNRCPHKDNMDCTNKAAIQDACLDAIAELMLVYEDIEDEKEKKS